ncbi:MAG: hypothetical protein KTR31_09485 [Myxococcales bacterium]|nr:hypothetical protein [Myxococcales bacterium]
MGKLRWYFAPCSPGLEGLLAEEVAVAGGTRIRQDRGGVSFQGTHDVGYRLVLWSRVAIRVLQELARARVGGPDDLYTMAHRLPWHKLMGTSRTFAVYSAVSGHLVRHSKFAALRVKDAVVDQLREQTGDRPSVDTDQPDVPLKITVRGPVATLSRDLAGDSLHRRGWRPIQVRSPINEALAAGLLQLTGWDRRSPLCDPMCGSGTFLVEAAHLAADRAPGLRREMALQRWPDFDEPLWTSLLQEAEERFAAGRRNVPALVGNDHHAGALAIARDSAERAEVAEHIQWHQSDVRDFRPDPTPATVVVNPPFGVRLQPDALAETWGRLGDFLKGLSSRVGDDDRQIMAWLLSADPELTHPLKLRSDERVAVVHGGLDCRWIRYPLGGALPPR